MIDYPIFAPHLSPNWGDQKEHCYSDDTDYDREMLDDLDDEYEPAPEAPIFP